MDKALVLFIGWAIAFLTLKYRRHIKEFTGNIGFAERFLGSGGTNTLIVIIGILIAALSLMYALGTLQSLLQNLVGPFFLAFLTEQSFSYIEFAILN